MRFFLYTGLLFSLLLSFQNFTYAQTIDSLAGIEISISLSPELPQSNQEVTATVSSSNENVRTATIVWLLDNEVQQQKPGGIDFTFTTGNVGSSQQVSVLVKTATGAVFTKSVLITPAEVTLFWEGDTYVPPFYNGRALYSSGSSIRAEALATFRNEKGETYNASELIYTWSKNGTVLGSLSGIGANTLLTEGPKFFGDYILAIEVATPDGIQRAQSATRIKTQDPQVILYEKNPLTGVQYHAAIDGNHIFAESSQIEVQAIPYFMDARNENDENLLYSWNINGTKVFGVQDAPSVLTIQLSGDEDAATSVDVTIDHLTHLLQVAKSTFNIVFEGSARNSLFGF
ncbi:hypothetical protein JXR01_02660 [Candidatus Kaiserbacteria bacterium]|nr:MAG: hypothetical protein JXR01_02660 [Candidatus Kaiserbacteria bacterium]